MGNPVCSAMSESCFITSLTSFGISPAVGSSTIITFGSLIRTMLSASICLSPPLRVPASLCM